MASNAPRGYTDAYTVTDALFSAIVIGSRKGTTVVNIFQDPSVPLNDLLIAQPYITSTPIRYPGGSMLVLGGHRPRNTTQLYDNGETIAFIKLAGGGSATIQQQEPGD